MGLYDREYLREEVRPGGWADLSMVTKLIIVNVAVFVVDMLSENRLIGYLELDRAFVTHPWEVWRLLSYGFVHDPTNIWHLVFNMYGLWLFGRDVENIYGSREFLRFYLLAIFVAGLVWLALQQAFPTGLSIIGASGGVTAVMLLYVQHFPNRQFLLFFVVPTPAWVLGIGYVLLDLMGAVGGQGQVAYEAHLAGAAFAFLYFRAGWRLERFDFLDRARLRWKRTVGPGRHLKIHDVVDEEVDLQKRLDQILAKISEQGESSLTAEERRFLSDASRRYQRRRQ